MIELNSQDERDIKKFINIVTDKMLEKEIKVKDETLFKLVRRMQDMLPKFGEEYIELTTPQNKIAEFCRDVILELFNNIEREDPSLLAEPDNIIFENFANNIASIITIVVNDHPKFFRDIITIIVKKYNEDNQNMFDEERLR